MNRTRFADEQITVTGDHGWSPGAPRQEGVRAPAAGSSTIARSRARTSHGAAAAAEDQQGAPGAGSFVTGRGPSGRPAVTGRYSSGVAKTGARAKALVRLGLSASGIVIARQAAVQGADAGQSGRSAGPLWMTWPRRFRRAMWWAGRRSRSTTWWDRGFVGRAQRGARACAGRRSGRAAVFKENAAS